MTSPIPDGSYPIREFARLTGVNPATLRAWERRYGIIHPLRTPKGHRFFSDDHIRQVKRILYWLEQGYPVRHVGLLLNNEDHSDANSSADTGGIPHGHWLEQQQAVMDTLLAITPKRLDELWCNAFSTYPVAVYYQFCLAPVLDRLRSGSEHPMLLRMMEQLLQRKLYSMFYQQQRMASPPTLLMATNQPEGELDILIRACAIGAAGLRVEYLGPNLNPTDLSLAADALQATHIWVHFMPQEKSCDLRWQRYLNQSERMHILTGTPPDHNGGLPNMHRLQTPLSMQIQHYILNAGRVTDE